MPMFQCPGSRGENGNDAVVVRGLIEFGEARHIVGALIAPVEQQDEWIMLLGVVSRGQMDHERASSILDGYRFLRALRVTAPARRVSRKSQRREERRMRVTSVGAYIALVRQMPGAIAEVAKAKAIRIEETNLFSPLRARSCVLKGVQMAFCRALCIALRERVARSVAVPFGNSTGANQSIGPNGYPWRPSRKRSKRCADAATERED